MNKRFKWLERRTKQRKGRPYYFDYTFTTIEEKTVLRSSGPIFDTSPRRAMGVALRLMPRYARSRLVWISACVMVTYQLTMVKSPSLLTMRRKRAQPAADERDYEV